MGQIDNLVVAITGASRGIGRAAMGAFARQGYSVLGIARSEDRLREVCSELRREGLTADHRACDLADPEAVDDLTAWLRRKRRLKGLVLNAGTSTDRLLVESKTDERLREMTVNYLSPAQIVASLAPALEARKGFIVGVGSLTGLVPFPSNSNYAASKAALAHLLRSLRVEMSTALHVGVVLPGFTDTDLSAGYRAPRWLTSSPEDVAAALVRCVRRRERIVIPGLPNQLLALADAFAPRVVDELLRLGVRRRDSKSEAVAA